MTIVRVPLPAWRHILFGFDCYREDTIMCISKPLRREIRVIIRR